MCFCMRKKQNPIHTHNPISQCGATQVTRCTTTTDRNGLGTIGPRLSRSATIITLLVYATKQNSEREQATRPRPANPAFQNFNFTQYVYQQFGPVVTQHTSTSDVLNSPQALADSTYYPSRRWARGKKHLSRQSTVQARTKRFRREPKTEQLGSLPTHRRRCHTNRYLYFRR